ncbi:MAG: hypothetical protein ABI233_04070 [Chthoniobacterales bacterium]
MRLPLRLATIAAALTLVQAMGAQEIRRAEPVHLFPGPTPVEIRRALPVYPAPPQSLPPQQQSEPAPPPPPTATPIPQPRLPAASVNDTARFLAGLPISESSSLVPLTREPSWQQHAAVFNQAWARLATRQFAGIRSWEANYLPQASGPVPVVYYLFSGPDYLYADQFFPNASTYILAGTEPIGPLPDITGFAGPSLDSVLHNLQTALNSVLSFSFFITKDMKADLQRDELKGTLPIFYVFLARAGKTITDISFLTLDRDGNPTITSPGASLHGSTPGVRITFAGAPGSPAQTLYYFTTDLSNEGIRSHPGFMKFCASQNVGMSLLKSASYLMFQSGFENVRDFLLTHSSAIIEDDSGIPLKDFDPAKWNLRLFGSYTTPIDLFKEHYQPDLAALYNQSHPPPLEFGIGYRWSRTRSTLILAQHK